MSVAHWYLHTVYDVVIFIKQQRSRRDCIVLFDA